ncbi:MAG: 4a-hydroxytetrahydrobiopterin dehydratase [Gammaproteobacteria bacterium]|nr:4a-hydroxytetrahydrobiopterin dehydratase [Gammaproteobacteria bacterium]MBT8134343.1 4a-hydroxytetrahydrobiopterin dehydratase [Gammaproteobacteria bacterium]NNJ51418.1 pterin-4-alpha-carbinolamine dehydratase [Gammaproteobacteria bacterium]
MSQQWQERTRPVRLERRYEFQDYHTLRDFLDKAAELSEEVDLYPDMGFGRDYVNITIHLEEGVEKISDMQHEFASKLDSLAEQFTN